MVDCCADVNVLTRLVGAYERAFKDIRRATQARPQRLREMADDTLLRGDHIRQVYGQRPPVTGKGT